MADGGDIEARRPPQVAGGARAVAETVRHALVQTGMSRAIRVLSHINQDGGFDCPGCAWPEVAPGARSAIEFCENGAKAALSEATTKRADAAFFARHSLEELASHDDAWLERQGRLAEPMVLEAGALHYRPIDWQDAFASIASELCALSSPDQAVFYTSGRTSNEAAFLLQLFVRAFGTNNLPDCSNMCHESSGVGLKQVIGVGKGTVQLEDFDLADAIFVVGQNPGTNHPRMLATLQKASDRGAMIVSVNPLAEVGTTRFANPQDPLAFVGSLVGQGSPLARLHVPVRINGDVAFFQGVCKAMLEEEARAPGSVLDHEFIAQHTAGFEAFALALARETWTALEHGSGVSEQAMRSAARVAIDSRATIVTWAMGLTQHANAVDNVYAIVNCLLLRGMIGIEGAGVCPVRGHSNVQGDRTMGISHAMPGPWLERLGREFRFEPPERPGLDVVESIRAMLDGRVRVFFAMGGNLLSAAPDTERTAHALRRCNLTVHVSTKLNRGHLVTGQRALILPCLGRTEVDLQAGRPQFVTVEDSMGIVHASRGSLAPSSPALLSETRIVARLAEQTLAGRTSSPEVHWARLADDYDLIRDHIATVVPGCEKYRERVRAAGGFRLRNLARERRFETATGKAQFTPLELPGHELAPGQLFMMTIRSHDQYNTTIYGSSDRYRGIHGGRRAILMNPVDASERKLAQGDFVDITSHFAQKARTARRFVVCLYDIPKGCCATYFPEGNVLVPLEAVARLSNTPASKSVVVSVERASEET